MSGLDISRKYEGLRENRDRQKIMDLLASQARHGDIAIDPVETSWCAAWINFCERSAGNEGTGKLNARSFLDYGTEIDPKDRQPGDILIFARGSNGWQGHVTYFVQNSQDPELVFASGGNQGNIGQVSIEGQDTHRLLGVRRP